MKSLDQYLKNLLKKSITETLEEKVDMLMDKIKKSQMEEGDESLMEGEMCEQCGSGKMNEGECMECGYMNMREGIYDVAGKFKEKSFDYIEEENDEIPSEPIACVTSLKDAEDGDIAAMKHAKKECRSACKGYSQDELMNLSAEDKAIFELECKSLKGGLQEGKKLVGKQRKLDKNKNNKIDAEDFKLLRKSKKGKTEVDEEEMEEGNKFTGMLAKARRGDKFTINGKTYKDTSDYDVKESIEYHIKDNEGDIIKLTEEEVVNLIENIIQEDKIEGFKTMDKPKGLSTYEKAHKESGKENDDYFKSFTKKMKDYLKDGSKGEYSMNPKMFPMGNGQLAKMSKKAYVPSDAVKDYVDNFTAAALENLDYDGIEPNEEWVSDLVKGSSRTGNNPKWANAVETDVNDKRDKIRKDNLLGKAKRKAYNKAPQPIVTDKTGEDEGDKILRQLESLEEKKSKLVNEEFNRMKELLNYNRKTQ